MSRPVWGPRFPGREASALLDGFNASIHADAFLAGVEVRASTAWALALERAGVLTPAEGAAVRNGLEKVGARIAAGESLEPFEDIHSAVELLLTEEIGEAGKKLHTGRSRNDQVATDERLYLKGRLPAVLDAVAAVQERLVGLAEGWPDAVMPGYTHLQRGQPVLFAHYALAPFWALERGKARLRDALRRIDVLPLGSGALAGTTAAVDRDQLRELLGFAAVAENSIDAVGDRSFILEILAALALVLLDVSRLAEDLIIFSSAEFGFLDLDPGLATSSSLMPQKKNPDLFELLRAAPGRLFGHWSRLFVVLKGLPSAYSKDLQEDKEPLFFGTEEALRTLEVAAAALARVKPRPDRMRAAIDASLYATDLVDELVAAGLPFREAHGAVAEAVAFAERSGKDLASLSAAEWKALYPAFGPEPARLFDPEASIRRKKTFGSTHPEMVRRQLERAKAILATKTV